MSATRLHRMHPDIPLALFTDRPDLAEGGLFAEVVRVPELRQRLTGQAGK